MKVMDFFSGIGGLSIGFQEAGFEIVYANDIDSQICKSFQENHPNVNVDNRDINSIKIQKEYFNYKNKVNVIMGGPPCQGFSQKGKRLGLNDNRNFLFRKFLEIIKFINPDVFLMENVPNLITSSDKHFINEIRFFFFKIGFSLTYQIVNAYDYGVPQKRKRAIIVGSRTGQNFIFPEKSSITRNVKDAISDLPVLKSGEGIEFSDYNKKPVSEYQKILRLKSDGIWNHISTNHSKKALEKLRFIPPFGGKEHLPKSLLTKSIYSGTWCRINPNKPARTITTRFDTPSSGEFTLNDQDRCLTVREAARIQSFPDRIRFHGPKTSQMIQVGNAVPPLLANQIAISIKKVL